MTATPLQPYDIYNLNASFKREQRHGLSANDALLQHLKDKGVHFKINITATNRTRHLFIAYPQSIKVAQTNQDVILVDNTYKANKFDMPLLHAKDFIAMRGKQAGELRQVEIYMQR
jgi:hypothetical protein